MLARHKRRTIALAVAFLGLLRASEVCAEEPASTGFDTAPLLGPPADLKDLAGRPLTRVEVFQTGDRWKRPHRIDRLRVGTPFSAEAVRRTLQDLAASRRYADVRVEAERDGEGVALRFVVRPRRVIASIRVRGGGLDDHELLRAARVRVGGELTAKELPQIADRVRLEYARRGYPEARVRVDALDTDNPLSIALWIDVNAGPALKIVERQFAVWPDPNAEGIADLLKGYDIGIGARADQETLREADTALEREFKSRGWHRASIKHELRPLGPREARLEVKVYAWARVRLRFEGNRRFDRAELTSALAIDSADDLAPLSLVERLRDFYIQRGLFDVEVRVEERGTPRSSLMDLVFFIREGNPVRVVAREYPCLTGERTPSEVGSEIDSFLSELPGGGLLGAVDPRVADDLYGSQGTTGQRAVPSEQSPWSSYVPEVYERAVDHLRDLYRSEGYLSASVGPVQVLRRACALRSRAGECIPVTRRVRPRTTCAYDEVGLPREEAPSDPALSCVPDPKRGVRCEPEVVLHMPIKLGPRSYLYDLAFEGNRALVERQLAEAAELELGEPVSQSELDKARRRLLDAYAEEGFAFAEVETMLDLSFDHTRGRARYVISEREPVRVSRVVIRGARMTNESLIRGRIALEAGGLYRRSLVRKTEERLATLGVFSSVSVGLEDPHVPARDKVVVITVEERKAQYLDVRPGFSTGEGYRITFEYGHRNLAGEAIQLTLRTSLGYLPDVFILDSDVRSKYGELDLADRLERRNSVSVEFPEIGLGPLFRLNVEGVDVRDNARDFGLTKDAGIVTLIYRPDRRFSVQLGASLERNDASIFGKVALREYIRRNPQQRNAFRVPEGTTVAVAQRLGVTLDQRDNPLDATQGFFVSAAVEHVHAEPTEENTAEQSNDVFAATTSDFLRYTNRTAGYIRLNRKGLALAMSFRWGLIQQLIDGSRTYPDRLFFMGGVDSIRGFLQDSLIPQDIADELLREGSSLEESDVVIRGGDVFINPRMELRIPITGSVQTALFLDSGNLWTKPRLIQDNFVLRYAVGTGVRLATPIGPLVFDYGFNVDRVLDRLDPSRTKRRTWEDIGAFHFSIGVF